MFSRLLLSSVGLAAAFSSTPVSNGCDRAPDCTSCLDPSAGYGTTCGWCAVNTTVKTHAGWVVGPHCADLSVEFNCDVSFQTDSCNDGYVCPTTLTYPFMSSDPNANKTCVPMKGGQKDKSKCDASCSSSPPPPMPPGPKLLYECDFTNALPTCKACTNATRPECHYHDKTSCDDGCAWKYKCDPIALTCNKTTDGSPTEAECMKECQTMYQCDDKTATCQPTAPNSTIGPSPKYANESACMVNCPAVPGPLPQQVVGIWRGLSIENTYAPGEWIANITNTSITIFKPASKGAYTVYLSGSAKTFHNYEPFVMFVHSVAGAIKGDIKLLCHDFSMNPEVDGYIQIAVDEGSPGNAPVSYDTAMTTSDQTVLGFEVCPGGTGGGVICTGLLDMVLLVDGSNSISRSSWSSALSFLTQLVDFFQLAVDKVEIGVVQFSENAATEIGLSPDKPAVEAAITSMRQMKLNTNTGAGLEAAETLLKTGGRANASKAVILLTDGKSNQGMNPVTVADRMKSEGLEIFGVGVGSGIDVHELQSLCSLPLSSHYFTTAGFAQLSKILQALAHSACHHTKPTNFTPSVHNCYWHLPTLPIVSATGEITMPVSDDVVDTPGGDEIPGKMFGYEVEAAAEMQIGVTLTKAAPIEMEAVRDDVSDVDASGSDPCNPYTTCGSCIGVRAGGKTCGWCNGDLSYHGVATQAKCAGKDNATAEWTCTGKFQTSSCGDYQSCGLHGQHRGLEIDEEYEIGEWDASFTPVNQDYDQASFVFIDPTKGATQVYTGKIACLAERCDEGTDVPLKLTLTNGTIIKGMCGYGNQAQAETTGLYFALSDVGLSEPPTSWDSAMIGNNASVFTYWKCADYKKGICIFQPPP